ncbi:MAG: FkbM family methyltransferase [Holophagales bacterium]|nr:FkbM family methyltransferase [Holophagales bacterium]MBK9967389.1 FkbM family methyltransferase [Holophagales bacterium]
MAPGASNEPRLVSRWAYYLGSILPMLRSSRQPFRLAAFMLGASRGPFLWELRSGVRFRTRTPLDAWVVKETWLDRFYAVAGTPVVDGWTVLDIGAGVGDFAVLAAKASPSGRVFAFEPAEDAFVLLEENLRLNGVTNVVPFREALGAPGDGLGMAAGPSTVRSRTFSDAEGRPAVRPVPTVSLEDALDRLGTPTCDLAKLDVEGWEERILLGARPETLRRIRHFVLEVHEERGSARGDLLAGLFAGLGYETKRTPNPAWPELSWLYARRR